MCSSMRSFWTWRTSKVKIISRTRISKTIGKIAWSRSKRGSTFMRMRSPTKNVSSWWKPKATYHKNINESQKRRLKQGNAKQRLNGPFKWWIFHDQTTWIRMKSLFTHMRKTAQFKCLIPKSLRCSSNVMASIWSATLIKSGNRWISHGINSIATWALKIAKATPVRSTLISSKGTWSNGIKCKLSRSSRLTNSSWPLLRSLDPHLSNQQTLSFPTPNRTSSKLQMLTTRKTKKYRGRSTRWMLLTNSSSRMLLMEINSLHLTLSPLICLFSSMELPMIMPQSGPSLNSCRRDLLTFDNEGLFHSI